MSCAHAVNDAIDKNLASSDDSSRSLRFGIQYAFWRFCPL